MRDDSDDCPVTYLWYALCALATLVLAGVVAAAVLL